MARTYVQTFDQFLQQFPENGTAIIRFSTAEEDQHIIAQVRLPTTERFLTYVHEMDNQSAGVISQQANTLAQRIKDAGFHHDPVRDVTPGDPNQWQLGSV